MFSKMYLCFCKYVDVQEVNQLFVNSFVMILICFLTNLTTTFVYTMAYTHDITQLFSNEQKSRNQYNCISKSTLDKGCQAGLKNAIIIRSIINGRTK